MDMYKSFACEEIDKNDKELNRLGSRIWKYAEVGGREEKSCNTIMRFLKKKDFAVTKNFQGIINAFKADYGEKEFGGKSRPNVAFLCRYDAVRDKGHTNGNNLMAEVAVAAAIGLQTVIQASSMKLGRITVIGSPNSANGGLVPLLNRRAFKDVDVVFAAVPGPRTDWNPAYWASKTFKATYRGSEGDPDQSVLPSNALDGAVSAIGDVLSVQQHFGRGWRAEGVITHGGESIDKKPLQCQTNVSITAPSSAELTLLEARVLPCFDAAARSSRCDHDVVLGDKIYHSMVNSTLLAYLLQLNAYHCGMLATPLKKNEVLRPVDVSNVSRKLPVLRPMFYIGTDECNGTEEFKNAANTVDAYRYTIAMAKALAMTAVDILHTPGVLADVRQEHQDALVREKNVKFVPFPKHQAMSFALQTAVPPETNTGWSRKV